MALTAKKYAKLFIPLRRSKKDARRRKFSPDHPPPRGGRRTGEAYIC
jgi:hypothetical protein